MKVLLLTALYPTPANAVVGIAVARERRALEGCGLDVDLVHCAPSGRAEWIAPARELRRKVSSGGFDLVHAHYGMRATMLSMLQPLPVVVTYHGTDLNGHPVGRLRHAHLAAARSLAARLTARLASSADAIIVMSNEMRARLPAVAHPRTSVRPMGVDLAAFRPRPRAAARQLLGWGAEPVVVVCDGASNPVKNVALAESAVAHARATHPELRLFVLRDVAPELVPIVLNAADALIVTSTREGSPNIVRESLASTLPIVSVHVGDIGELLAAAPQAGRIASPSPAALGSALCDMLAGPRPAAPDDLVRQFSLDTSTAWLMALYQRVLAERAPAGSSVSGPASAR